MIKALIIQDEKNNDIKCRVVDGLAIFVCENSKGEQFVVSQFSENQSIQLNMIKSILNDVPTKGE